MQRLNKQSSLTSIFSPFCDKKKAAVKLLLLLYLQYLKRLLSILFVLLLEHLQAALR